MKSLLKRKSFGVVCDKIQLYREKEYSRVRGKKRFYSEKQLQEIDDDIDRAVTIPVNTRIKADHRVYDYSEVEKILPRPGE